MGTCCTTLGINQAQPVWLRLATLFCHEALASRPHRYGSKVAAYQADCVMEWECFSIPGSGPSVISVLHSNAGDNN